jgi:hypothetical protein
MMRPFYFKRPCEICDADPFWWNNWERDRHVRGCEAIKKGLDASERTDQAQPHHAGHQAVGAMPSV